MRGTIPLTAVSLQTQQIIVREDFTKMDKSTNITPNDSKEEICPEEKVRIWAKRGWRLFEGARQLIVKPYKNIFIAVWAVALGIMLNMTPTITENIIELSDVPIIGIIINLIEMQTICEIVATTIIVFFLIALVAIVYLIGIPSKAKDIDRDVTATFIRMLGQQYYYMRPFLIRNRPLKNTDITEFHFYCRWLSKEDFKGREEKILKALNCERVEGYRKGKGFTKYILVILAGENEAPSDKGALYGEL